MTEERAKKVLQEQIDKYGQEYDAEGIEALEMAIKALEQQPCEDCVSREDVVRILDWSKASVQMLDDYSADELVGEIITIEKEVENLLSVKPQTVTDFADKCKECGKILNETYQQKWIPVSEKMPPIAQRVLVSATNGKVFIARYHSFDKWTFEPTGISYAYNKDSIVAWMPLPQPYRAESEGEG